MAAGRDVGAVLPFLALQRHVALFLLLLQVVQQQRHATAGRMLQRQRDEYESDPKLAQIVPRDGVLLVEPLERRRVVERKASLREPLANLCGELLDRSALRGRKL